LTVPLQQLKLSAVARYADRASTLLSRLETLSWLSSLENAPLGANIAQGIDIFWD
jgi:hypothetical protein